MEKLKMPTSPNAEIRYGMLQNEKDFVDWVEEMITYSKSWPDNTREFAQKIFDVVNQAGWDEGYDDCAKEMAQRD